MVYKESVGISSSGMYPWSLIVSWQFTPWSYSQNTRYTYEWSTIVNEVDFVIRLLSDANFRLYSTKIYKWWNEYLDLVPCYRKSDWEIWLYDLVNDVFYTNQWSWTFSKWNDIGGSIENAGVLSVNGQTGTVNIVDDTAFWPSWDWDTTHAPSKNAVYDAIWNIETLLAAI